jgi:hypothetical protein
MAVYHQENWMKEDVKKGPRDVGKAKRRKFKGSIWIECFKF